MNTYRHKWADPLCNSIRELAEWANLRKEQRVTGFDVQLQELDRQVHQVVARFQAMQPPASYVACEPSDLAEIRRQRPAGPRTLAKLSPAEYRRRLHGAVMARAAGCLLGSIVEFWSIDDMEAWAKHLGDTFPPTDYWSAIKDPTGMRYSVSRREGYTRSKMTSMEADDDLIYTWLGLLILEDYGLDFTTADVGAAWKKYLPLACTAEKVALENLNNGVPADKAGEVNNPYITWIGADIRSDPWGYVCPSMPEKAAEFAHRDAFISHRGYGIHGEMFFSAAIAAAFAVDDPIKAVEIALSEIPADCRMAGDIKWALDTMGSVRDYRDARQKVQARFDGFSGVHTGPNAALTIFALKLGNKDVTRTIGQCVAMGLDNDCTAATAGSIVGAVVGIDNVAPHWYKPFNNKVHTYINGHEWMRLDDLLARFEKAAAKVAGLK
jgi:ADP-ribosylglycohydrolase